MVFALPVNTPETLMGYELSAMGPRECELILLAGGSRSGQSGRP